MSENPIKKIDTNETEPCCGMRECAKTLLRHKIEMHHEKIKELVALQSMLPTKMTQEQDTAVWRLISSQPQ